MQWTDIVDIALALEERYPDHEILRTRFTELRKWVLDLPNFKGDPQRCNEKILEAIQMAWLDERA